MEIAQRETRVPATERVGPRKPFRLRERSRQLVLTAISRSGPISPAQLSTSTGLSRSTIASVVSELVGEGRVVGAAEEASGRGRPPQLLSVAPARGYVVGIDFGHSHISIALADRSGAVLAEHNQDLDVDASSEAALKLAAESLRALVATRPDLPAAPSSVVMGVPGPIDNTTGRLRAGTLLPGWTDLRPAAELAALIGSPVLAENDANLSALGELAQGAGRSVRNFLYVKAATGIGAGVIIDGALYRGARGTAGEIGHVQIRENGSLCRCGSRGCLETVASAGFAESLLRQRPGSENLGLRELTGNGSPAAGRVFNDMGRAIGRVVADVSSSVDPEYIIVGGRLVDDAGELIDGIAAAVNRYTQPYVSAQLQVIRGALGRRAALVGAIALAVSTANSPPGVPAVTM